MDGPKVLMVTKASAERIGHLSRDIEHLPSHTDHRGLVRFDHSTDSRYLSVIGKLKEMVVEASQSLQSPPRSRYSKGTTIFITMFLIIAVLVLAVALVSEDHDPNINRLPLRNHYRSLAKFEHSQDNPSVMEKLKNMAERTQHTTDEVEPASMYSMQIQILENKALKRYSCTTLDELGDISHDCSLPSRSRLH